ncbi:MAG: hypothetical protein IJC04_10945 [Oscillospiraceae bacterium]|nr:hypothetical protein [Oscillospiraceae bacterium]
MNIYYLMIEAVPNEDNDEREEVDGAYINFWVKANEYETALKEAMEYIDNENWQSIKVKDSFIAKRELYIDEPDSLECYDEACENGIAAIFYTW